MDMLLREEERQVNGFWNPSQARDAAQRSSSARQCGQSLVLLLLLPSSCRGRVDPNVVLMWTCEATYPHPRGFEMAS